MIRAPTALLTAWILAALPAPAARGETTCQELIDLPSALLEQAAEELEERRAAAIRDASLADPGDRRFLEALAAAVEDAALAAGVLPALSGLIVEPEPSPAELYGLIGDLLLVAGHPEPAVAAYAQAFELAPGRPTRCAARHGGRLYTFESGIDGDFRFLTPYLLSRDPDTGEVRERLPLPSSPIALSARYDRLQISYKVAWKKERSIALTRRWLDAPVWAPENYSARFRLSNAGLSPAQNFVRRDPIEYNPAFTLRRHPIEGLPADLESLEAAARSAIRRDPTQPWHLFVLGQCLWAQDRRSEATAAWNQLLAGDFPAIPYYEYTKMARLFELYGQPAWADAAFREALARRRAMPVPITRVTALDRRINGTTDRLVTADEWPELDVERAYLWWLRLREISGVGEGDAFRAALWANYFAGIGDRRRAAAERAYLERARRESWPPTIVYIDYAIWLFLASAGGFVFLVVGTALRAGRWLSRRPVEPCAIRAATFAFAAFFAGKLLSFLPPESPLWLPTVFLLLWLIHASFFSFLPLIVSALRTCRRHLGPAARRHGLAAAARWTGTAMLPVVVLGGSLAALSFAILYVDETDPPIDVSDVLERPARDVSSDDTPGEQRFETALAHHLAGDFRPARRLYASLPATPRVRRNLEALARRLPPLVFDLTPSSPNVDLPALAREWLRNELWQPWRLPFEYNPTRPDADRAPLEEYFATHARARIALQVSPVAFLTLLLRPVRRALARAVVLLLPGAGSLRQGRVARAYLTFWLFLFAAGPLCWLLFAWAAEPDHEVFGPHAGAGPYSSRHLVSVISPGDFALPPPAYPRLLAENFWSLLWLYPHARGFYSLVALALCVALWLHGRQISEILGRARASPETAGYRRPKRKVRRFDASSA